MRNPLASYTQKTLTGLRLGSDATAHMAEETRNASLVIPRAMVWSYVINGLMVFLMLITYCFVSLHSPLRVLLH